MLNRFRGVITTNYAEALENAQLAEELLTARYQYIHHAIAQN